MKKYRGVFPALYACYDSLGRIDPRGVRNLTRFLCDRGVGGIFVNGKPENAPPLSVREKIVVMENVMAQAAGRTLVICQAGCAGIADTLEVARHAALCGADAAAVPRPAEGDALEAWRRVAACAPDTDMIFCDVPLPADAAEEEQLAAFAAETRPRGIVVPEDRSGELRAYRRLFGEEVSLFSAREADYESTVGRGADAVISYVSMLIPEECVRRESDARFGLSRPGHGEKTLLSRLDRLFSACESPRAVAREALRIARGLDCGCPRPPEEMSDGDKRLAAECVRAIHGAGL